MPADKNTNALKDIPPPDFSARNATPERVYAYLLKLRAGVNEARRRANMNTLTTGPGLRLTQTQNGSRLEIGKIKVTCSSPGPGFDIEFTD